ncbi:MAG: diguanylate cyclase [Spirochaetales bacterium]|jgi:diguanylate cyclase (GGDEF)-like protein|nr:diguanylate cyclase [Spirochaetales bacterium]
MRKNSGNLSAALRRTAIFEDLRDEECEILLSRMERVKAAKGKTIFREGAEGEQMYVILKGNVSISTQLADGTELLLASVDAGSFFGDMAIIENAPRSATCTAARACDLLSLNRSDFYDIIHSYPEMALKILYRMLLIMSQRFKNAGAALTEMVRWGEGARKKAISDEATGLFNRRFLDESFGAAVSRALGNGKPLSFAMVDMDHFSQLNKKYGEAFGDEVILAVSEIFRESFRETDILARCGGDEFAFIFPDTHARTALRLCGDMTEKLRRLRFAKHPKLTISLSIGIASVPENADSHTALKEAADRALYEAKEEGRDRIVIASSYSAVAKSGTDVKTEFRSIAEKNRSAANIIQEIFSRKTFLLLGHKDPDADCIASLVAFALLLSKLQKKIIIFLPDQVTAQLNYLLEICKYNAITVIQDRKTDIAHTVDAIVILDTPKPGMIMMNISVARIFADPNVRKIEIDHHLDADSRYSGDSGFRLVSNASSTCELIGYLSLKLSVKPDVQGIASEFFSRNLALTILTGIVGDSQMGKYLKTSTERWYYRTFSKKFNNLLHQKTQNNGRNLQSMKDIFDVIQDLSQQEKACLEKMKGRRRQSKSVHYILLGEKESAELFACYGGEIIVNMSKAAADQLSETSTKMGLVGYYDPPVLSGFIQFRLRRSPDFSTLDLRTVIAELGITNGGGHPGAVGFRMDKKDIEDIAAFGDSMVARIEDILVREEVHAKTGTEISDGNGG